jgi:hypothetical protein
MQPANLARRRMLQALASVPVLALPASGLLPGPFDASFLQIWRSHLDWTAAQWRAWFAAMRGLGCREVIVQWVALENVPGAWRLAAGTLGLLLDSAREQGLGLRLGLPYDGRWWNVLRGADDSELVAYLDATGVAMRGFLEAAPEAIAAARHAAFSGWYLPYEIEQYNWSTPARTALLLPWLQGLANVVNRGTTAPLAVSTYYSQLPTAGRLENLWAAILDRVPLRAMIQDGAGVAGPGNYEKLVPLCRMLTARGAPFDIIVELFRETNRAPDGTTFEAVAAPYPELRRQQELARQWGAERRVAFALDPWMTAATPQAQRLLAAWRAVYGQAQPTVATTGA